MGSEQGMNKYRIGIVGGSGFIGFSLVQHLSRFFDVKILDIKKPLDRSFEQYFELCDIRDHQQVKKAFKDIDLVIHTAIVQIPLINEQKKFGYEVNFLGTQNVCRAVDELPNVKGMILAGSWHTIGERELYGVVDEEFGYRPDKVEDRARLYALSKIAQEAIVRFYDEMSDKIFGIIRMGTVIGEGMPEKTAANIFIERGLKGDKITPYKHSMYRPMFYVDIKDVCKAYEMFVKKILNGEFKKTGNSSSHIFNIYYPEPITILELAEIVRDAIMKYTNGKVNPKIEVVDQGIPMLFTEEDKNKIKVNITKAKLLGVEKLTHPRESIERIIKERIMKLSTQGHL
jgi:UDP-glucose 4-epimerase